MVITRKLLYPLLALTVAAAGTAAAVAEPSTPDWKPCGALIPEWDPADTRSECTTVRVPLNHAAPDGRTIDLMVSRISATSPEKRRGVVVINPGGPGNSGLGMPAQLSASTVAGIGVDHDLIGFDPRGVGFSGGRECDPAPEDGPDPDPKATPEERFRQGYRQTARQNVRCAGYDPEFIASLSTAVVAEDLDRIRLALGEEKIGYYGISWGTALGAVYRSRFDDHVDRMVLDSVMPADFSMREMNDGQVRASEANFARFARWVAARNGEYHLGRTGRAVTATVAALASRLDDHPRTITPPSGDPVVFTGGTLRQIMTYGDRTWPAMAATVAALRDGEVPPLLGNEDEAGGFGYRYSNHAGLLMQVSVLCNDQGPDPDVDTLWQEERHRAAESPLFSWKASYQHWCAAWPLPSQPWNLRKGTSPLLLVGHRTETVTPHTWAVAMRHRIGGRLLTVEDGVHGSLSQIPCGQEAVDFFRTGRVDTRTCPGAAG